MAEGACLMLAAEFSEIARMNAWFDALARRARVPSELAGDLKLCLNEAVANVIGHGYPQGGPGEIAVTVTLSPDGGAARIADDGIPFDPLAIPDAPPLSGPEDDRVGGFGIKLIRSTARELRYRRAEGRNVLSIVCGQVTPDRRESAAPGR